MTRTTRKTEVAQSLTYQVGNTYVRIPDENAKLDNDNKKKIHDWILYCDVTDGNPDLIQYVVFDLKDDSYSPRKYTCRCPIRTKDGHWRFSMRQATCESLRAQVTIRGRGGAARSARWNIVCEKGGGRDEEDEFWEPKPHKKMKAGKMIPEKFRVGLDITCDEQKTVQLVADCIKDRACLDVSVFKDIERAANFTRGWKILPQSRNEINVEDKPDDGGFQLASRTLRGGQGLNEFYKVLCGLRMAEGVKYVKNSFYVYINVEGMQLHSLKKICQVFVKFEDAMDTIMPLPRRTRAPDHENSQCKSNKLALGCDSNDGRNRKIAAVSTHEELCDIMNPNDDPHYKLNLQYLQSDGLIGFQQHTAATDYDKMSHWVRFCMAMVKNSARLREVKAFREDTRLDSQFSIMFEYVIKDRCVRNYYQWRRDLLKGNGKRDAADRERKGSFTNGPTQKKRRVPDQMDED